MFEAGHGGEAPGEFAAVGDDEERDAFVAVEGDQQVAEGVRGLLVEGAGRFVGEQQPRSVDERADDGGALGFAPGEASGAVVEAGAEPHALEQGACAGGVLSAFGCGAAEGEGGDEDVLQHGALRQEEVLLEDEADGAGAEVGSGVFIHCAEIATVEADRAGGGDVEGADEVEQRALAAARRAYDRERLAGVEGQRDAIQHADARGVSRFAVLLADIVEFKQMHG